MIPGKFLVINKVFLTVLLLLIVEIVAFMVFWSWHRLDYVKTGCGQFEKAGFYHITRDNPLYSKTLDPHNIGVDCQ